LPNDEIQLELREIKAGDRLTGLSLGDPAFTPLKIFAQKHAKNYAEQMLAKSYGVFEGQKLLGYVALVCGQIEVDGGEPAPDVGNARFDYKHYPAVKIARLAVDQRYRKTGLGGRLVDFSLGLARDTIASAVGCRFVVLDAKQQSVAFYEKNGFRLIDTATNRARAEPVMFLDLKGTPAAVAAQQEPPQIGV
jgi:GNAT superfamily N-acetyltransferase